MEELAADVLVIGAGAAGLIAARELERAGLSTVVIEARERVGGRLHTLRDPAWPIPVEAGAEFVHGEPPGLLRLLAAQGLHPAPAEGSHAVARRGDLRDAGPLWEAVQDKLAHLPPGPEQSVRARLAHPRFHASPEEREMASSFLAGFNAADPARASIAAILQQTEAAEQIGGDALARVREGYGALADALARDLRVLRGAPVRTIRWRPGQVEVLAQRAAGPLRAVAPRALVTLPLGVLQAPAQAEGAVAFEPSLPRWKENAIAALEMGAVVKVTLLFEEPPWERWTAMRDLQFLHAPGTEFPVWWVPRPFRAPVFTAWAAGPAADALASLPAGELIRRAQEGLASALGVAPAGLSAQVRAAVAFDWRSDPYARGAYSWVPVGQLRRQRTLAAPIDGTLYFAGEATEWTGHCATVHGAVQSGLRAAAELIDAARVRAGP